MRNDEDNFDRFRPLPSEFPQICGHSCPMESLGQWKDIARLWPKHAMIKPVAMNFSKKMHGRFRYCRQDPPPLLSRNKTTLTQHKHDRPLAFSHVCSALLFQRDCSTMKSLLSFRVRNRSIPRVGRDVTKRRNEIAFRKSDGFTQNSPSLTLPARPDFIPRFAQCHGAAPEPHRSVNSTFTGTQVNACNHPGHS